VPLPAPAAPSRPPEPSSKCDEFLLRIARDGRIKAEYADRDGGRRLLGEGDLDLDDLRRESLRKYIQRLYQRELGRDELRLLGGHLYAALFPGQIGRAFREAVEQVVLEASKCPDRLLRVCISVDRHSEVVDWPLEFLFCTSGTGGGYFLATHARLALSRRIFFEEDLTASLAPYYNPPLKVLIVVSRPEGLDGVVMLPTLDDITRWAAGWREQSRGPALPPRLAGMRRAGQARRDIKIRLVAGIKTDWERVAVEKWMRESHGEHLDRRATFGCIREEIQRWSPHVLHFIGHGRFDEQAGLASLALEPDDDDGEGADWCVADDLSYLFAEWRPHLVLLQACESAKALAGPGFMVRSLAECLIRQGAPAVVAMQFEISNEDAIVFTGRFYEALAQGLEVDAAVQAGRVELSTGKKRWGGRHFGAPVLFTIGPIAIIRPLSAAVQRGPERAVVAGAGMPSRMEERVGRQPGGGAWLTGARDRGRHLLEQTREALLDEAREELRKGRIVEAQRKFKQAAEVSKILTGEKGGALEGKPERVSQQLRGRDSTTDRLVASDG